MKYYVTVSTNEPEYKKAYDLPSYTYGTDSSGQVWFRTMECLICLSSGGSSYSELCDDTDVYIRPFKKGDVIKIEIQ